MNKTKRTTESQSGQKAQPATAEPREAALTQAERDTAGFQKKAKEAAEHDPRTQAQKFADAAREHGASDDESAFKGVLRKLTKPKA